MRAVIGWLGRTGVTFVLLCLAVAFATLVLPSLKAYPWREDAISIEQVREELATYRAQQQDGVERSLEAARKRPAQAIRDELGRARATLAAKQRQRAQGGGWLDSMRPSRILAARKLDLEISALEVEIAALDSAARGAAAREALKAAESRLAQYRRVPTEAAIGQASRRCEVSTRALGTFRSRSTLEQMARNVWREEERALVARQAESCGTARRLRQTRATGIALERQRARLQAQLDGLAAAPIGQVADMSAGLPRNTWRDIATKAAWLLALVLIMPILVRLLCWFVLAPLAERRATIRLAVPGRPAPPAPSSSSSAPSMAVTLGPDEELLVRARFLQSTPAKARKATRWLLDWHHPLASLASGMRFLTAVQGAGSTTTVSAAHDPFAEVALLDLPEGTACVLQPRALAAVAQPQRRPVRITSHWRLFSLNAWLTLQLRYLVFHGPARLVIKGGRGVRVERAERGRVFGSDQLIGFSADLSYSVTRNETFWPYFLGYEPLLRDQVSEGAGILILEEAPLASRRGGHRRGVEGMVDAAFKAFGV